MMDSCGQGMSGTSTPMGSCALQVAERSSLSQLGVKTSPLCVEPVFAGSVAPSYNVLHGDACPQVALENIIKEELPCVSHAVVIGDRRRFVSCLLTLKVHVDEEDGKPTTALLPAVTKCALWLHRVCGVCCDLRH